MPASAPIPREVGECFENTAEYGRYIIATGPYMFEGSENLNAQSCDTMQPISGYNPTRFMNLVRNPSYDPATDSPEYSRGQPGPHRVHHQHQPGRHLQPHPGAASSRPATTRRPRNVIREYITDPELRERLRVNDGDRTWYLTMDMTQPPFDDIHVRKAMNLVMDLEGLQRAWGGPDLGSDRDDHHPRRRPLWPADQRGLPALPEAPLRGRRGGREGRDGASRSTTPTRTARATPPRARAS